MRAVLWICAASLSLLALADAHADGDGLTTDVNRVPWARFQARLLSSAGAPGWRADLAPLARAGLQVTSFGLLGDLYFSAKPASAKAAPGGFRATSGVIVSGRSGLPLGSTATSANGLPGADRRLFGASAAAPSAASEPSLDGTTVPYLGIGYSNLALKSGWSFSADLGVISQSPSSAVRLGRVFGGSQSLDDVVRDMRLAPVIQLGVSYSF